MTTWIEIRPVVETAGVCTRRAEGEAWRAIVREKLGEEVVVSYNAAGAPVLPLGRGWIGVSHTRGWVAVVWSPHPCAIDIELSDRKLRPSTAARCGIGSIAEWCALEARYKYRSVVGAAGEKIDFFEHDPAAASDIPEVDFIPHPELVVAVIR